MAKPNMPQVSAWANDLRGVFGADEMAQAMGEQGYFAAENGHEFGARIDESNGVTGDQLVLILPDQQAVAKRARR